ncbi:MAG: glycosyltransferase [Myxococcota bacterium]
MSEAPAVSVLMMAYNHGRYIGRAIESVLAQDFEGGIELIVADDCSPDDTVEVARRYEAQHPDIVKVRAQEKNLTAPYNFIQSLDICRGRYIAMFDGDDYWIHPGKLRQQVALLDENPQMSMCFTSVHKCVEDNEPDPQVVHPKWRKPVYTLADLSEWVGIETSSVLLRTEHRRILPEWFFTAPCGDWPLFVFWAERGDIGWIPVATSVHRLHATGAWAGMRTDRIAALKSNLTMLDLFIAHLGDDERARPFHDARYRRYYDLAHEHADAGEPEEARKYLEMCTRDRAWADPRVSKTEPFKILLKLHAPLLDKGLRWARDQVFGEPGPPPIRL